MTTPPFTITGLTPRQMDRDSTGPVSIDVASSTEYDLDDVNISFSFPLTRQRPTSWDYGEWITHTAQQGTAKSRPVTFTAGIRDVYTKILAKGHTFVILVGRVHVG